MLDDSGDQENGMLGRTSLVQRFTRALTLGAVFVLVSSCGTIDKSDGPPMQGDQVERTTDATGAGEYRYKAESDGELAAQTAVGRVKVRVSAPKGVVASGAELLVKPAADSARPNPRVETGVSKSQPGIEISLGDGQQPRKGVQVVLDVSNQPEFYGSFSDDVRPIVLANPADPANADVFAPKWDVNAKTLTFTTYHFSSFWPAVVNLQTLGGAAAKGVTEAVTNLSRSLSKSQPAPKCDGEPVLDGKSLSVAVDPLKDVAACVEVRGESAVIKLSSRSTQYFEIRSPSGGSYVFTGTPSVNDLLFQRLHSDEVLAILTPGMEGEITLPPGVTDAEVGLRANPIYVQLGTLAFAADIVIGAELPVGDSIKIGANRAAMTDCALGTLGELNSDQTSGIALGYQVEKCLGTAASIGGESLAIAGMSRIGAMNSLFTTGPEQVWANLMGVAGEVSGANRVKITLAADKPGRERGASEFRMTLKRIMLINGGREVRASESGPSGYFFSSWELTNPPEAGCAVSIVIDGPQPARVERSGKRIGGWCEGDTSMSVGAILKKPGAYNWTFTLTEVGTGKRHTKSGQFMLLPK